MDSTARLYMVKSSVDKIVHHTVQRFSSTLSQGFKDEDLGVPPAGGPLCSDLLPKQAMELPKSSSSKPCDRVGEKRCKSKGSGRAPSISTTFLRTRPPAAARTSAEIYAPPKPFNPHQFGILELLSPPLPSSPLRRPSRSVRCSSLVSPFAKSRSEAGAKSTARARVHPYSLTRSLARGAAAALINTMFIAYESATAAAATATFFLPPVRPSVHPSCLDWRNSIRY